MTFHRITSACCELAHLAESVGVNYFLESEPRPAVGREPGRIMAISRMEYQMKCSTRLVWLVSSMILVSCAQESQQPPAWSNQTIMSNDGVEIHYQIIGKEAPSLVFVHGWSCDRSYWKEQLEHFAGTHTVLALDLAGHGDSGLNRDDWTIASFGEDVAAVTDHLELEQVVLVGHSMGASVIVEAALRIPDRVSGLVVVDAFKNLDSALTPEIVEIILGSWTENFAESVRIMVSSMFVPTSDSVLVAQIVDDMSSASSDVGIAVARDMLLWSGADVLSEVVAPIQAINSDSSPTNLEAAERHGIDVTLMSGVGHFVMMEDAETFNALLEEAIADFGQGDRAHPKR